jgi:hypothetical protein
MSDQNPCGDLFSLQVGRGSSSRSHARSAAPAAPKRHCPEAEGQARAQGEVAQAPAARAPDEVAAKRQVQVARTAPAVARRARPTTRPCQLAFSLPRPSRATPTSSASRSTARRSAASHSSMAAAAATATTSRPQQRARPLALRNTRTATPSRAAKGVPATMPEIVRSAPARTLSTSSRWMATRTARLRPSASARAAGRNRARARLRAATRFVGLR